MFVMSATTLSERFAAAGAQFGEYCGTRTPAHFGDADVDFRTLHEGSSVFDLSWKRRLRVTGDDRVRWLNGMVTNNIRDLAPGHGVHAFLLTAQGRIQGDMYCFNVGEALIIESDAAQLPRLREMLEKYIIMDDVALSDDPRVALGIAGRGCAATLAALNIPAGMQPAEQRTLALPSGATAEVVCTDATIPGYKLWLDASDVASVWDTAIQSNARPTGYEALELHRIYEGRPRFGSDITDRDLPQETAQDRALNFNKGCYIGQEIVERIRARGAVHRVFTSFVVDGPPPATGTKILADEKEVGEVTCSARIPLPVNETRALGYIRREALGAQLTIGGAHARPLTAREPALAK